MTAPSPEKYGWLCLCVFVVMLIAVIAFGYFATLPDM